MQLVFITHPHTKSTIRVFDFHCIRCDSFKFKSMWFWWRTKETFGILLLFVRTKTLNDMKNELDLSKRRVSLKPPRPICSEFMRTQSGTIHTKKLRFPQQLKAYASAYNHFCWPNNSNNDDKMNANQDLVDSTMLN